MERIIIHSDFNAFYASVETLKNPALAYVPMAVGGDAEKRHGIVLSKNDLAKKAGVKTGEVLWQARQKCPGLVVVQANMADYRPYSLKAREIYSRFTDRVEPFGSDECWLDVSGCRYMFGSGEEVARQIHSTIAEEMGLTVSIGLADNKIFAKLGSDLAERSGTTVITKGNYRDVVWRLPVQNLLYVGPATARLLTGYSIRTIGELAQTDVEFLERIMGKNGIRMWQFANGYDMSPVDRVDYKRPPKSIGNSKTTVRDLVTEEDFRVTALALSESVGARLRKQGLRCSVVHISIRDAQLESFTRQRLLTAPTANTTDIFDAAIALLLENRPKGKAVRSIEVRATNLEPIPELVQQSFFPEEREAVRRAAIDEAVDKIRGKLGHHAVVRGLASKAPELYFDAERENANPLHMLA